jgi:hypothetical protein
LQLLWLRLGLPGKKRQPLLSHFVLKMITLPRQARDKQKGKFSERRFVQCTGDYVDETELDETGHRTTVRPHANHSHATHQPHANQPHVKQSASRKSLRRCSTTLSR